MALVDSGAGASVLHADLAEILGFGMDKLGTPTGTGTSVGGYHDFWTLPEPLMVEIYGFKFNLQFIVVDNRSLVWPCILGEDSIFRIARLDFQKYRGFFEIRFREDIN